MERTDRKRTDELTSRDPDRPPPLAGRDPMAVAAMVSGIIGFAEYVSLASLVVAIVYPTVQLDNSAKGAIYAFGSLFGGAFGIVAIVLGFKSRTRIGRSNGRLSGHAMATAGIWLGVLLLSIFVLIVISVLYVMSLAPPTT